MKSRERARLIFLTVMGVCLGFMLICMVGLAVSEPPAPIQSKPRPGWHPMRRVCLESPTAFFAWGRVCFSSPVDELTEVSWRSLEVRM